MTISSGKEKWQNSKIYTKRNKSNYFNKLEE